MDTTNDRNLDALILLEEATPYERSLKWDIHTRYFQEQGNKAWLNGEVPYNITCNSAAARQNAALVHAAVESMERSGSLRSGDPIRVLEIASGLGLFAVNFIRAFRDIDLEKGTDYSRRLTFFLSDFAEKNVKDAAANPALQAIAKRGQLEFCVVNALEPDRMRLLSEENERPIPPLAAVIGNYVHCCLPLSIVRKNGDCLQEKLIRLSLLVPLSIPDREAYAKTFIEHPVGERITENLREEVTWHNLPKNFFDKPLHEEIIREGSKDYPVATVIYPRGSFASIEKSVQTLLPGGVILISDKGYADASYMEGERSCEASIHGNSFAHSLNFPLIDILAKRLQCRPMRTCNPHYSLQTILIETGKESNLAPLFTKLFIDGNDNVESSDFQNAARKFEETGQHAEAVRFFKRAQKLRPYDASLFYRIGCAACEGEEYDISLKALKAGKEFDYFNEYDFDFKIGYVLHLLHRYGEAIPFYRLSQERTPSEITLYNLGLCLENQGDTDGAILSFRDAVVLKPDYESAQSALKRLLK